MKTLADFPCCFIDPVTGLACKNKAVFAAQCQTWENPSNFENNTASCAEHLGLMISEDDDWLIQAAANFDVRFSLAAH